MRLGDVDVDLLLIFEAINRDRSVTKAGKALGLSQPAMSHALNRLRWLFKDQLFVRTPKGMVPTPRAEGLTVIVRRALAGLEDILEPEIFDPQQSERRFVLACSNYAAIVLAPDIACRCRTLAPHVGLSMRPGGALDTAGLMDTGELDLVLSATSFGLERISSQELFKDEFAIVMRPGHPLANKKMTRNLVMRLEHLAISSSPDDWGLIDERLAEIGLSRPKALEAPFLSAGSIILQSDLVTILTRRLAASLVRSHGLVERTIALDLEPVSIWMHWPRRLDDQKAHRWLRHLVSEIGLSNQSMTAPTSG